MSTPATFARRCATAALTLAAVLGVVRRRGPSSGYRSSAGWRVFDGAAELLDRKAGWYKLPLPLGLATLVGIRNLLRQENLYDTTHLPSVDVPPLAPWDPSYGTARSPDG